MNNWLLKDCGEKSANKIGDMVTIEGLLME
jgi:hypothetical protein